MKEYPKENYPAENYLLYLRGCAHLSMRPLSAPEFKDAYQKMRRVLKFLHHFDQWRVHHPGQKSVTERRWKLYQKAEQEWKTYRKLYLAVKAGQAGRRFDTKHDGGLGLSSEDEGTGGFGSGGAGFPVRPRHDPPTLSGAATKLLPYFDPEPAFRDP
jgi:hypothetical protein